MSKRNNNDDDQNGKERELAFILLIPILALSVLPIAGSPTIPIYQSGVVQCQTIQNPIGMETPGCLSSITFPKPFLTQPTSWGISVGCVANTPQTLTSQNITSICAGLGAQTQHPINIVESTVVPVIPGNYTWKNYPVRLTPACNIQVGSANGNCDVGFQFQPTQVGTLAVTLSFNCITGGFTGNEWMGVQYSLTGGASWITTAINDSDVGSLCPLFPAFVSFSSTIQVSGLTQAQIELRLIGGGGNGLSTDNITFFNIALTIQQDLAVYPHPSIGSPEGNNNGGQIITKTGMVFFVEQNIFNPMVPIMAWWACTC